MIESKYVKAFMKLGFIAGLVIEIIDEVSDSKMFKQQLKFHLKEALKELEKTNSDMYSLYSDSSLDEQTKDKVTARNIDIYNVVVKAYDFLLSKEPTEIAQIAQHIKILEEKGFDIKDILLEYTPIK